MGSQRYRWALLLIGFVALVVSFVNASPRWGDTVLHHIPTVALVGGLVYLHRRLGLDDLSYTFIFVFVAAHILGARYLYSNVPYEQWSQELFGFSIDSFFGFERNHYDRCVHFLSGLLLQRPIRQALDCYVVCRPWLCTALAIVVIVGVGALYEVCEWGIAVLLAPETAERYNGQQGDMWDAQKDMALAFLGALCAASSKLGRAPACVDPLRDRAGSKKEA